MPSTARNQDIDFVGPPFLLTDAGTPAPDASGGGGGDAGLDQTEAKLDDFDSKIVELEGRVKDLLNAEAKRATDAGTPPPPNNL